MHTPKRKLVRVKPPQSLQQQQQQQQQQLQAPAPPPAAIASVTNRTKGEQRLLELSEIETNVIFNESTSRALVPVVVGNSSYRKQQQLVPFDSSPTSGAAASRQVVQSSPEHQQQQQQKALSYPRTGRNNNSDGAGGGSSLLLPAHLRMGGQTGIGSVTARDVVLSINEGDTSFGHRSRGKSLPPLAMELSAFMRREGNRTERERQELVATTTKHQKNISSSRSLVGGVSLNNNNNNNSVMQQQPAVNMRAKLTTVREALNCLSMHFPGYSELFGQILRTVDENLAEASEVQKKLSELELLRTSSESYVEQSMSEAKLGFERLVEQLRQQQSADAKRIAELEAELDKTRGDRNFTQRRLTEKHRECDELTTRVKMFQHALEEETRRSIDLTRRLSRLTATNKQLKANIDFMDQLLKEAEMQIEKSAHDKKNDISTNNSSSSQQHQATRKVLADANRKNLKRLHKAVNDDGLVLTDGNRNNNQQEGDEDDVDEGEDELAEYDEEAEEQQNDDDDDDDDPDMPISRRADEAVLSELSNWKDKLFHLDVKVKRLATINNELMDDKQKLQERIDAMCKNAELDRDSMTPRPAWLRVNEVLPQFQLNTAASSDETLDDVLVHMHQELNSVRHEAEARIMGNVMFEWLGEENLGEGDFSGQSKAFVGRGTGPQVPVYLRATGFVKNRRMRKFGAEAVLKKFWNARRKALGIPPPGQNHHHHHHNRNNNNKNKSNNSSNATSLTDSEAAEIARNKQIAIDYFFIEFLTELTGTTKLAVELSYNILNICEQHPGDSDCNIILRVLRGEISEFAVYDQMDMLAKLEKALRAVDVSKKGKLSRATIHRVLLHMFPAKQKDSHLKLRLTLALSCGGSQMVDIRGLFREDSEANQSKFVEALRSQHLEELLVFSVEVDEQLRGVAQRDSDFIDALKARTALHALDPAMPDEVLCEIIAAGCNLAAKDVEHIFSRSETIKVPTEPFLGRIRRGVLVKRYGLADPEADTSMMTEGWNNSARGGGGGGSGGGGGVNDHDDDSGAALSNLLKQDSIVDTADDERFFKFMERIADGSSSSSSSDDEDDEAEDQEGAARSSIVDDDATNNKQQDGGDEAQPQNGGNNHQGPQQSSDKEGKTINKKKKNKKHRHEAHSPLLLNRQSKLASFVRPANQQSSRRRSIYHEREIDTLLAEDDSLMNAVNNAQLKRRGSAASSAAPDQQDGRSGGGGRTQSTTPTSSPLARGQSSIWQRPLVASAEASSGISPSSSANPSSTSSHQPPRLGQVSSVVTAVVAAENFRRVFQQRNQQQNIRRRSMVSILHDPKDDDDDDS